MINLSFGNQLATFSDSMKHTFVKTNKQTKKHPHKTSPKYNFCLYTVFLYFPKNFPSIKLKGGITLKEKVRAKRWVFCQQATCSTITHRMAAIHCYYLQPAPSPLSVISFKIFRIRQGSGATVTSTFDMQDGQRSMEVVPHSLNRGGRGPNRPLDQLGNRLLLFSKQPRAHKKGVTSAAVAVGVGR